MELISQISSSTSPEQIVQQFVQITSEHPDNLKETLCRLFNALRSKNPRHRANIAFALTQLFRKIKKNLDLDFVFEFSREVLMQDSTTVDHRRSTIACFFAWNAMCRAGIFKSRHDIIEVIIQNLFPISNERICYRLIGYETIWSVIESTYKSKDEFQKELFSNIVNEMGQTGTPPHAESFSLWIRINRNFPGLPLKKWAANPCSSGTLRSFSSMLENTTTILPQIHPVWTVLASVDANQIIYNTMELWGKTKYPDGYIPMMATIASLDYLECKHFITILDKYSNYYINISNSKKYSELFTDAVLKKADSLSAIHKNLIVSLSASVIKTVRSTELGKFLSKLNDNETNELLDFMRERDSFKFDDFLQLLWAQTRRDSLSDSSLVTRIFDEVVGRIESDDDRKALTPLLCHASSTFSGDGKHWFSLMSPDSPISGVLVASPEILVKRSKLILDASSKLHKRVGLDCASCDGFDISDLAGLTSTAIDLMKSQCPLCQSVGRFFAQSCLSFIEPDSLAEFSEEPLVLLKALSNPKLVQKAISMLFVKIRLLPRNVIIHPERVVETIEIGQDEIVNVLPSILAQMRSSKPNGFQIALTQKLIDKLDEENRQKILEQVIEEQLADYKKPGDSDFVPMFIRSSVDSANFALKLIMAKLNQNRTKDISMRARGWLEEVTDRYQISPEFVAQCLKDLIDIDFDDSKTSARKRAEEALGWLLGFLSSHADKEIPNEPWTTCLNKFADSKSRTLQTLVKLLGNPETVNENENENNNENENDNNDKE